MTHPDRPQQLVAQSYDAIAERYAAWTGEALIALRLGGDAATPAVTPVG
ncbi:MAG: hypothetical protein KC442_20470 [Thermomicrobiales bacterium]|nr:hypothetical protein [Thermomicrobiales bacterium]MCA9880186.1 hypothetical protein [Thermomicrobiales bacterium]